MSKNIDIVIPNYNKVEFIEGCLQSLVSQTYENWRCIVVDGYSDDGSWEIIQEYASGDDRFELYQLDRIGLYKSWNFGLRKVQSPYFAVLTSDDAWTPQWLEVALKSLSENREAIAAAGRTKYIDSTGDVGATAKRNSIGESIFQDKERSVPSVRNGLDCSIASYFMGTIFNGIHSFVVRSNLLDELLFPTDVGTAGDLEWCMRIGLHGDIVYCPNVDIYWRRYDDQASGKTMGQREELGESVMTMVDRVKPKISDRLSGARQDRFQSASRQYVNELLPFFFKRPPLSAFGATPIRAVGQAVRAAISHPRLFAGELRNYVTGRERYVIQERANLARSVIESSE